MRRIALFGSTGSIGTQALEVISFHPELLTVYALTTHRNVPLLVEQAEKYHPAVVVVADEKAATEHAALLKGLTCTVLVGAEGLCELAQHSDYDVMLSALVGFAGLRPTLLAIESGHEIALANKETLVVAGQLIMRSAREYGVRILPVDSEHSAIYQCLMGEETPLERIWLTASGGPFWQMPLDKLSQVTVADALHHPRWSMGAKVTIDSATMMNKGFEMMEACHLFAVAADQISILIHPESVVHSMVQFADGSVKAQLAVPDMRLPISLALHGGVREPLPIARQPFVGTTLHFEEPDAAHFPCLSLAFEAFRQGGNIPCLLNAANEVAVRAFLDERIGFTEIARLIEPIMTAVPYDATPTLDALLHYHDQATALATEQLPR
ncbi:1-deoxy-D-xylulose-5-phosphate reductoisomerase [uncultured Porphyromonas sp.]|uniref:1-deoxy-D-xylulose-5-phosphate reductoisomerase n=1 Tax=uncultured Porphyromonas sp. TaxID=159274 RepID=UPI00280487CF|nr:1-deoxy-D-xylulose-5-phosphate reductoisomerase [uncultured Porphyromonas sp.]